PSNRLTTWAFQIFSNSVAPLIAPPSIAPRPPATNARRSAHHELVQCSTSEPRRLSRRGFLFGFGDPRAGSRANSGQRDKANFRRLHEAKSCKRRGSSADQTTADVPPSMLIATPVR